MASASATSAPPGAGAEHPEDVSPRVAPEPDEAGAEARKASVNKWTYLAAGSKSGTSRYLDGDSFDSDTAEAAQLLPKESTGGQGSSTAAWQLAGRYVWTQARRDKRGVCVGIWTVALVVGFMAVLQSAINILPIIFVKLSEDQTGQTDLLMVTDGFGALPFLNNTDIEQRLAEVPEVIGVAPRWVMLGRVANRDNPLLNTSVIILVIDSDKEKEIGIGKNWDKRSLGDQETYLSTTALSEIDVKPDAGERTIMTFDILSLIGGLGGGIDPDDPSSLTSLLTENGLDMDATIDFDVASVGATLAQQFGFDVDIPPVTVPVSVSAIFTALYPALRQALILEDEFIVVDEVDDPMGKWAPVLGNVMVIESKYAAKMVQRQLDAIIDLVDNLGLGTALSVPGVPTGALPSAGTLVAPELMQQLRDFSNTFDETVMAQYAIQVGAQFTNRDEVYPLDSAGIKAGMIANTNAVFEALGVDYPVSATLPLVSALAGTQFIALFLSQIVNTIAFLMGLLGVLVIYSLILGDVEAKTYEYGMLRALGMRNRVLIKLLTAQTTFFSIPGIIVGLLIGSILYVGASLSLSWALGTTPTYFMPSGGWIIGIVLGTIMPAIANVVPIRRALSSVLRDALDMYHRTFSDVSVRLMKLAEMGLSAGQTSLAIMLIIIGFVTFYLLPLAFLFSNFGLFLGILTGILMGMVLGLSLVSQALQASLETLLVYAGLSWNRDHSLITVLRKNLAGHRTRNRKTAYMITISVSFLLFVGTMFSLQTSSLATTVEMAIGSDIITLSFGSSVPLPQEALTEYLDRVSVSNPKGAKLVQGYTFITFPMNQVRPVSGTRISNLVETPRPRASFYGIQKSYTAATFQDFAIPTERVPLADGTEGSVIDDLINGDGQLVLPVQEADPTPPPLALTGAEWRPRYVCNIDQEDWESRQYTWSWQCERNCPNGLCSELARVNMTELSTELSDSYTKYVDIVMSEALREYSGVDTTSPLRLRVESNRNNTWIASVSLAKARAMVRKMPGFFFSTYSQTGANAPVLLGMQEFGQMLLDADAALDERIAQNNGQSVDESGEAASNAAGSGSLQTAAGDEVSNSEAEAQWLASSPAWTKPNDARYSGGADVVGSANASLALDNNAATGAVFSGGGNNIPVNAWFVADTGVCVLASRIRVRGTGTVGDVREFRLSTSASLDGTYVTVAEGMVGSITAGTEERWYEFELSQSVASRYWKFEAINNHGWAQGTVVTDIQLRGSVASSCADLTKTADDAAIFVPKQRLLVRLKEGISAAERGRVKNGLRSALTSDLQQVQDTADLLSDVATANLGMQIFFNVVAGLCLVLTFFAAWLSFSANLRENSREFGVLRALGLTVPQVLRVYVYESLAVVLTSYTLGALIGIVTSVSLTLQFNIFTEMPFQLDIPPALAIISFVMCVGVAVVSSYLPARRLVDIEIANVLKGKQ